MTAEKSGSSFGERWAHRPPPSPPTSTAVSCVPSAKALHATAEERSAKDVIYGSRCRAMLTAVAVLAAARARLASRE